MKRNELTINAKTLEAAILGQYKPLDGHDKLLAITGGSRVDKQTQAALTRGFDIRRTLMDVMAATFPNRQEHGQVYTNPHTGRLEVI